MFTGLIEEIGRVAAFERRGKAGLLRVETTLPQREIAIGKRGSQKSRRGARARRQFAGTRMGGSGCARE